MSNRLSVVMIAKNAADLLPDCLDSVSWADEIIVLDSGSTDSTVELARRLGAQVYTHTDWRGYGIQRQRAQDYATGDWVLMIDTDERVTPELRHNMIIWKSQVMPLIKVAISLRFTMRALPTIIPAI